MNLREVAEIVAEGLRSERVAAAAGLEALDWVSPTHVFRALGGWIGGRNRGRCPFVEYEIEKQEFAAGPVEGGALQHAVRVRVHLACASAEDAGDRSAAILEACKVALAERAGDIACVGEASIDGLDLGPMGFQRDLTVIVYDAYSRQEES